MRNCRAYDCLILFNDVVSNAARARDIHENFMNFLRFKILGRGWCL